MARLKLPAPPLPKKLNPAPKRPGQGNGKVKPTDVAKEAGTTVIDWVDERTSLSGAARWMMFRKVPKGTNWFYTLGSATMFAFLNQAITGVFLAMYYVPSPTDAYESARHITNDVFLGEFVRSEGPTRRFVYIAIGGQAGDCGSPWSRRAKIDIHDLPTDLLERALQGAVLQARLPGRDKEGAPACATLRPLGSWTVAGWEPG